MAFDDQTKQAAIRLGQAFGRKPWYSSIGISSEKGRPVLIIYTSRRAGRSQVPASWEGIPVRLQHIGRLTPA
jgi:hypothetical protein